MDSRALAPLAVALLCCAGGAATATPVERPRAMLRGSARGLQDAAAVATGSGSAWLSLGTHRVADSEGGELFAVSGDLDLCRQVCSNYQGCKSFAFCGGQCFLKDGEINGNSPSHFNPVCTTYYRGAATTTTTMMAVSTTTLAPDHGAGATASTPSPAAIAPAECHSFHSEMAMNQQQQYSGNPELQMTGLAHLMLCTNGTMLGSLQLDGVHSEIIATHIHRCEGGSTPQTKTSALCTGAPVVNFCGSNAAGLIADGTDYAVPCSGAGSDGVSRTVDMQGALVRASGTRMSLSELVVDIIAHTDMYYFNVHTMASWNHWFPEHQGACRGPMQEERAITAATTTVAPVGPAEVECFSMYSQLAMNELQIYAGNPDSKASGYASFTLCTNGTLSGTSLVFGGVSEIIATHIHHCKGGDTPQTRTADLCEGPPVINFCGSNAAGLIADGVEYPEACAPYGATGASRTGGMRGVLIPGENKGVTVADRVRDIAANPQSYFFNVHTEASWNQWYPAPKGSCRGPMQLWGA